MSTHSLAYSRKKGCIFGSIWQFFGRNFHEALRCSGPQSPPRPNWSRPSHRPRHQIIVHDESTADVEDRFVDDFESCFPIRANRARVPLVDLQPHRRRRRCELATAWLRCGHSIGAVAKALGYSSRWEFETAYSGRTRRRCADLQKMPPLASLELEELLAVLRPSWWPARGPSRVRIPQEDFAPGISADEWARIRRECAAAEPRKDAGAGDADVTDGSEAGGVESTNDDPRLRMIWPLAARKPPLNCARKPRISSR